MRELTTGSQESFSKNIEYTPNEQSRTLGAAAWAEIANLPKKPANNNGDSDTIFLSAIFKDEDSVTRCVGVSSPTENYLKCKTTDFKPLPEKNHVSGSAEYGSGTNGESSEERPAIKPVPKPRPDKSFVEKPAHSDTEREVVRRYTSAI